MTNEELRPLIAHWPKEAEYLLIERWGQMESFEAALADTQRVWAETWGWNMVRKQLTIERKETWKTSTGLWDSQQQRLL